MKLTLDKRLKLTDKRLLMSVQYLKNNPPGIES